jgi:DNA-binding Lrp family transcriptional regulator
MKIDTADKVILSNLRLNSHITNAKLAKLTNLSKDSIHYRIKRLEKNNIIQGYGSIIDYKKLGFDSHKLYLKVNCSEEKKNNIIDFLSKLQNIFSIFESLGDWHIATALFTKNDNEYIDIENKLLEQFGEVILEKKHIIMVDTILCQKNFFFEDNLSNYYQIFSKKENCPIDNLDKNILKTWNDNSKTSLSTLAVENNVSIDTIRKRKEKIHPIQPIMTTKINLEALGFTTYKIFLKPKTYSRQIDTEIIAFFKNQHPTINIIQTIGEWRLEVEFIAQNYTQIKQIISEVHKKFTNNVQEIKISVFSNEKILECQKLIFE